jgi:hypothetical protein
LQEVTIAQSAQFDSARAYFLSLADDKKYQLDQAATAAARVIVRLEPLLKDSDNNTPLLLSLQGDAKGKVGDVRDVLCMRELTGWQIGLSCKHNNNAVKHSRLSSTIDFGKEWLGVPCSIDYFDAVTPIFEELDSLRKESSGTAAWSDIEDKGKRFYVPILSAFVAELQRLDSACPNTIPTELFGYFLGRTDFYKVIAEDARRVTHVEGINLHGTLNSSSRVQKAIAKVKQLHLPTRFYHVGFKEKSQTTIDVACDNGWQISMRLHNAKACIEPSLKFDIELVSLPKDVYKHDEPWGNTALLTL